MSTSPTKAPEHRIHKIAFEGDLMCVLLDDGQKILVPSGLYPRLMWGTQAERRNYRLVAGGKGIHWPALEEDISLEGLMQRKGSSESPQSVLRWLMMRKMKGTAKKAAEKEIKILAPHRHPKTRQRVIKAHCA